MIIHATIKELTEVARLRPSQVKALNAFAERKRIEKLRRKQIIEILDHIEAQQIAPNSGTK